MTGARDRAATFVRLAAWLGPWADESAAPRRVSRRTVLVPARAEGERPFPAWLYRPSWGRPTGALLLAPGLHYAGPQDPRMDRFARVLAGAGLTVMIPFLPDYTALTLAPGVVEDFARTWEVFRQQPEVAGGRVGVFSISFGSLPALRLASDARAAGGLGGVVTFGGYADWRQAMTFCLTGRVPGEPDDAPRRPHDPLNRPVIFMNLLDGLVDDPEEAAAVRLAWRAYVGETWGRPEMKARERFEPVARRHLAGVPAPLRELYLQGVGLAEGGVERAMAALERTGDRSYLDPRPHLGGLHAPVHLVHGVDDDVIPHTELDALAAAAPGHADVRTYRTGLFGHTGGAAVSPAALVREIRTMVGMLGAIVDTASRAPFSAK